MILLRLFSQQTKISTIAISYKALLIQKGQSQRMLELRDVSQGESGREADCIRRHQDTTPARAAASRVEQSHRTLAGRHLSGRARQEIYVPELILGWNSAFSG